MRFFLPLLVGLMCPVCVPFFVWPHIWVSTIYVVNVFVAVLLYVDNYVGLMPHIMEWKYQL